MVLGFVGCGNMAVAMLKGIIKNKIVSREDILASALHEEKLKKTGEELGIRTTTDNCQVAREADILFLAVKPQFYETVIREIRDSVSPEQIVVSIAPGKSLEWLGKAFGKDVRLIRCMPNTPALVGEGITGVCPGSLVSSGELEQVCRILDGFGRSEVIPENLMDAVVGVSGSSPAYVFLFIEAMADAAVAAGMPRAQAYRFAAQAVYGSAKMVLETGKHPGELKDMVCSPAGTTIEAVRVLEEKGFRSAVMEAVRACVDKSRGM
ncbi:MAG: pyrroline-5-carboxylate reductase [Candidatus Limivivens sp.]|nr:pyrroline-5-carboxylate reductase [Candidatus Limivivens sp.]